MTANILIVEDEGVLARNLARFLGLRGHEAEAAGDIADGMESYGRVRPDIVLLDFHLPDGDGIDMIRRIRAQDRQTKIVMMTADGRVQTAVDAMKAGADDYVTKPFSLDELALLVERLVEQVRLEGSLSYFTEREERRGGLDRLVGESPPMLELKGRIRQLIATEERIADGAPPPVLILGETGTGKELVARALHFSGARRAQPFVEVNCAALPENLVESELFGHERGAFTDAKERKPGLFLAADRGTLFLDEIGELPPAIQVKLLRVLEERVVRPVGGTRERKIDVRIVAATNTSIEDQVRSGEFRSDLYFRLGVVTITTPPLRSRGDDVELLAERFLGAFARRYARPALRLGDTARAALLSHPWPGNVRELRNVMEQCAMLTIGDRVEARDLGLRELSPLSPPANVADRGVATLGDVERDLIVQALRHQKGNVTLAARDLGISRDTLRYRMEKHALKRGEFQ
ncbi:MAG: sigma-54-dependent Fis family transcriptional regulator [Alphaproteobacteria bacterium]|nr:sigma-54-dependent Fis family transcriptional regulator [Alphaproteobacteria bacterium]